MAFDWSAHNYDRDPRVANARAQGKIDAGFNIQRMTFTFERDDGEGDEPTVYVLAAKMEVCPTCKGRGKHVNPSIDAGSISDDDDFWCDDDDDNWGGSRYQNGFYDVTCETCNGKNVVAAIDLKCSDKDALEVWYEMQDEDAECERIYRQERLMGA
jgi:hypothetical protein